MDEVREAAERLRKVRASGDEIGVYRDHVLAPEGTIAERAEARFHVGKDEGILADAYLAEHPADDEAPVDEAWLRSIGFVEGSGLGHLQLNNDFRLQAYETQNWHLETKDTTHDWYGCYHSLDLSQPTTRRDVRRLLTALGISITPAKGG